MIVVNSKTELSNELIKFRPNSTIGLVPTMGALHEGHLSLILSAKSKCEVVIASIFVNPRQFGNPEDLNKYPNQIDQDLVLLEENGCDIVFMPSTEDVYTEYDGIEIDLSSIDGVMEGTHRQGHFKGVTDIVYFLFDLIKPTHAFFGLKDYQQVRVVKYMTTALNLPIEIVACETIREQNGLAKSSRNLRLSEKGKDVAKIIFQTLKLSKEWMKYYSPPEIQEKVFNMITKKGLVVEYVSIFNPDTLQELTTWQTNSHMAIAAQCEGIRLIDNLELS